MFSNSLIKLGKLLEARHFDVEMENLLGDDVLKAFGPSGPNEAITLYGKHEMRPGRKMGHVVRKV